MRKIIVIVLLAMALIGCDAVNTVVDGYKNAKAVETDLQQAIGLKPEVGFNWNNGRLLLVTVTFPRLYEGKPLPALAEEVRAAVIKEFKQAPDNVVLGFSLGSSPP
jgi:hypothetical protein